MLFFLKNAKSKQLEDALARSQRAAGPAAAWAGLPEDELFTPAGFRAEADATFSLADGTRLRFVPARGKVSESTGARIS